MVPTLSYAKSQTLRPEGRILPGIAGQAALAQDGDMTRLLILERFRIRGVEPIFDLPAVYVLTEARLVHLVFDRGCLLAPLE